MPEQARSPQSNPEGASEVDCLGHERLSNRAKWRAASRSEAERTAAKPRAAPKPGRDERRACEPCVGASRCEGRPKPAHEQSWRRGRAGECPPRQSLAGRDRRPRSEGRGRPVLRINPVLLFIQGGGWAWGEPCEPFVRALRALRASNVANSIPELRR